MPDSGIRVSKHSQLSDVSTPHVLADLESAVCSETEAPVLAKAAGVLNSKIKYETRDMEAASGDVSYTGYGFKPTSLIIFAVKANSTQRSWGMSDSSRTDYNVNWASDTDFRYNPNLINLRDTYAVYQQATLKTYDDDGFTLTWTKVGGLAAGNATLVVLALK